MNPQLWWWVSRATGMVAGILLIGSVVWGVLLATRALRAIDRPAWLLAVHRWFSALTCVAVGGHIAAIVADNYVHFGWAEVLVPGGSAWKRWPVALGVIAMYLLIAVQISSLLMKRIPRQWWKAIHLSSYATVWLGFVHGALAGTDASNRVYGVVAAVLTFIATWVLALRVVLGTSRGRAARQRRVTAGARHQV